MNKKMKPSSPQNGFTITELLIAVAILGIVTAMAMPDLSDFLVSQRIKTASYDLYADMVFSRSEAIKRNQNVTMSSIGTSGWTIEDAGGVDIRKHPPFPGRIEITGPTTITFTRSGRQQAGDLTFIIDDSEGNASIKRRCIYLDTSGRPSSKREGEGAC
jgi:type IV fimbrial biogenesis protein FimT